MQQSCSHSTTICNQRFKKRKKLRAQEQPLVAKHRGGTKSDRSRNRRTQEVPFIVGCSHFTRKNAMFRAPASSPQHSPCNSHAAIPLRSATRDSRNAKNYAHRNNHLLQNTEEEPKRPQPQPPHTGGTFHRRLQPLYTEKRKVSCSGFLPTTKPMQHPCILQHSLHHHFPPSPLPFITTSHRHHFPSSPLPIVTTSYRHHFPSSPLPLVTTSLRHHFPSSPLPLVTTSLPHHFPSSPLPFLTTSLPHHFPSSPLPIVTTSLSHHFPKSPLPSSPLPLVTTSLPHHFPSSPLPFLTTSLPHHFPSSPPPFLTTPLRHHFPSSPLPFVTTLSHSFLFLCYVLLLYVL